MALVFDDLGKFLEPSQFQQAKKHDPSDQLLFHDSHKQQLKRDCCHQIKGQPVVQVVLEHFNAIQAQCFVVFDCGVGTHGHVQDQHAYTDNVAHEVHVLVCSNVEGDEKDVVSHSCRKHNVPQIEEGAQRYDNKIVDPFKFGGQPKLGTSFFSLGEVSSLNFKFIIILVFAQFLIFFFLYFDDF